MTDDVFLFEEGAYKGDFDRYQKACKGTAIYIDKIKELLDMNSGAYSSTLRKVLEISYVGLGLGEVGEIQNKLKKIIRDNYGNVTDETRKAVSKELGDLLYYVAMMCNTFELSLSEVAVENILKLQSRKERGVLGGSGDER